MDQLPSNVFPANPRVSETGVFGGDDDEPWDQQVRNACQVVSCAVAKWQKDFQKEHTPNTLVSSFRVLVSGSLYLGIDGPNSDIDLVVVLPSHRGMASVRAVLDADTGVGRYIKDEGVSDMRIIETSRVPLLTFRLMETEVDVSFAVVPRDAVGDWDTTIEGLVDVCMDSGWRDSESLRAVIGLLGNRTMRRRATMSGKFETWRRAVVVLKQMAQSMGILSNMCRLLSTTCIGIAVLRAVENGSTGLADTVVSSIDILCPPKVDGGLRAVHIYDPHVERAPENLCSWRTSLQSDTRADAFLMSGVVHQVLVDAVLMHLRNADQAVGPRCLFVWYPTSAETHCCTVLVTHSVGMPQYITIYNALIACKKRVIGLEEPRPLFSTNGVLYGHVLNSVRIEAHPKQNLVVMALAQLVDDVAYDSHRSVHIVLWPYPFEGHTPGSVVYYIGVRTVSGRTPELRLDALLHMRLNLCGISDVANIVSIHTYNPTACSNVEREWVDRAVLTFPDTVMPWPPAARRSRESPASPQR